MFVKDIAGSVEFIAGDGSILRELFNPLSDDLDLRYSFAVARVEPGGTTYLHRLKTSEVYFVLKGVGEMRIEQETAQISAGQAVYVPPGSAQQITNIGPDDLMFICIVDPAWREEDEEILLES